MNSWKIILATLVIFGAGVVTGGLLVHHSTQLPANQKRTWKGPAQGSSSVAGTRLEFLRRAQRDLDLTPEQKQKIDLVLKEGQERTRKVLQPVEGELRQEIQQTRDAFRALLTPAQQARFDELVKRPSRSRDPRDSRENQERFREDGKSPDHPSLPPAPGSQP